MIESGPGWELRLGDYREVLADVSDACTVVSDPPYSARTHAGHDDGASLANRVAWQKANGVVDRHGPRRSISYAQWGTEELAEFAQRWHTIEGWTVLLSDSVLTELWRAAFETRERTGFHPLPCVIRGMTVRMAGDGPSSWAIYGNVSRPKALSKWGTLPGAYSSSPGERIHIGGKPLVLMRSLIRDYSKPDDLIVDPCAGSGTTLLAAVIEGRRAIGSEVDPEAFRVAVERLRVGYTPSFDF